MQRGQTEGQEHASQCLAMPSFQGTGKTNFLRSDDNEDELFLFLGKECQNTDGLQPCSHEEAYIRMLLHVKYPMNCGLKSVTIRTVGTDVVVVAVAHFQGLPNIE